MFAFLVIKWPPIFAGAVRICLGCIVKPSHLKCCMLASVALLLICFQNMQNFNKQWELCVSWLTQLQVFIILRLINLVTIKRGFNCLSVYWCNFLICNKGIRYISFSAHWLDINISIMFPCFCKNVLVQSADRHRANYWGNLVILRSTETCFVAPSNIYENKYEDYPFVVAMKLNQWTKTSDDALQSN